MHMTHKGMKIESCCKAKAGQRNETKFYTVTKQKRNLNNVHDDIQLRLIPDEHFCNLISCSIQTRFQLCLLVSETLRSPSITMVTLDPKSTPESFDVQCNASPNDRDGKNIKG